MNIISDICYIYDLLKRGGSIPIGFGFMDRCLMIRSVRNFIN
jgi:hypothetical protein